MEHIIYAIIYEVANDPLVIVDGEELHEGEEVMLAEEHGKRPPSYPKKAKA